MTTSSIVTSETKSANKGIRHALQGILFEDAGMISHLYTDSKCLFLRLDKELCNKPQHRDKLKQARDLSVREPQNPNT